MPDYLFGIDWQNLFLPTVPIAELVIRASMMYLGLFALLRLILKREAGAVSITDILVIVLLSEAAQNALTAGYTSITEGFILVTTIIIWNYILNWIGYHVPHFERLIFPKPLSLVEDGQINWENMRRELLTERELMAQLRQQGVDNLDEVQSVHMEGDGQISVIKKNQDDDDNRPRKKQGAM